MQALIVAQRYARALLDIGVEDKSYEKLGREVEQVAGLVRRCPELRELFRNPKFDARARRGVLEEVLGRLMVSRIVRNFLLLLVDRGRIGDLPLIAEQYAVLADERSSRVRAQVTVAARLSEPEAARLRTVLQKVTGTQVIVEQIEDPSIIGGAIARIGGRVYDGSVRAQLEALRVQLRAASRGGL